MRLAEVLTPRPVTVRDDATVSAALRLLQRHAVRHLPVVRAGRLVGILSERDLLEPAGKLVVGAEGELAPALVRHVMVPSPLTLEPEASVGEAAALCARWGIGCVPVVREGELAGLVTETDLLLALVRASHGPRAAVPDPALGACMTDDPTTVGVRTTLEEARRCMSEGDFRHLPIVAKEGRLVALVDDRDLLRAAGEGLPPRTRVLDLVREPPPTAPPDEPVSRAVRRMAHERLEALCVVDEDDGLAGLFTVTDALAHEARVLR